MWEERQGLCVLYAGSFMISFLGNWDKKGRQYYAVVRDTGNNMIHYYSRYSGLRISDFIRDEKALLYTVRNGYRDVTIDLSKWGL